MMLHDVGSNLISCKLFIQHCPTLGEKSEKRHRCSEICIKTFEMAMNMLTKVFHRSQFRAARATVASALSTPPQQMHCEIVGATNVHLIRTSSVFKAAFKINFNT